MTACSRLPYKGCADCFKVHDIHRAYQTPTERGVIFDDSPHLIADMGTYEIWMAFYRDSEQNVLAISSDIPHESNLKRALAFFPRI